MEMYEEIHPDRSPRRREDGVVRQLEFDGFSVVQEAADDIIVLEQARAIAEPWKYPSFIDSIVELQRRRHLRASHEPDEVQFHNRSAVCTAALAVFLGYRYSEALSAELKRIKKRIRVCAPRTGAQARLNERV